MRRAQETAIRPTVIDRHQLWADLERVRRDVRTLQHYFEADRSPEWREAATERLHALEEQERDLLQQLERLGAETR